MKESTSPSSEQKALDWLYGTQLFGVKLGLDNTHRLLDALDLPLKGQKFIHAAGTNGKGSTCAFAHSLLTEAGLSAGLFTSPHLVHFRERIRDGERQISSEELTESIERCRKLVADWDPHPTFFELTLAIALDWFKKRGLQWVVLETGMGGRLDATNALKAEVSIITAIGHDHLEILGPTLADVTREKAGIIKPGIPVITGPQPEGMAEILKEVADKRGAPFIQVTEPQKGVLGLEGPHQQWNAALAVEALRAAGIGLTEHEIQQGLAQTRWRGRFERFGVEGRVVLDGAHNPEAAKVLVETWQKCFGTEKASLIFGAVQGKAVTEVLSLLSPIVEDWHLVTLKSPRALGATELSRSVPQGAGIISCHASVEEGWNLARQSGKPVLVAGSLYLVGEVLALIERQEPFQTSAQ